MGVYVIRITRCQPRRDPNEVNHASLLCIIGEAMSSCILAFKLCSQWVGCHNMIIAFGYLWPILGFWPDYLLYLPYLPYLPCLQIPIVFNVTDLDIDPQANVDYNYSCTSVCLSFLYSNTLRYILKNYHKNYWTDVHNHHKTDWTWVSVYPMAFPDPHYINLCQGDLHRSLIDWLFDWSIIWLIDWLIEWFDWLSD